MTTTRTPASRTCRDCGTRRIDASNGVQLCGPCYDYAGMENGHSDYGHDLVDAAAGKKGWPESWTPTTIIAVAASMETCAVCHPDLDPRNVTARKGHTNTVAKTHTSHAGHNHPRTPRDRAICRKARAAN